MSIERSARINDILNHLDSSMDGLLKLIGRLLDLLPDEDLTDLHKELCGNADHKGDLHESAVQITE